MRNCRILTLVVAATVCAASQAQTFSHRTYAGGYTYNHADLNNDGREDLVYHTQTGFAVVLSTGSGTYAAPVEYNVPDHKPAGTVSLDVNNDGKLDELAFNSFAPGIYEYLNTGDGKLKLEATLPQANVQDMVVGDFNHDGYADIAFTTPGPGNGAILNVWFNDHSGGFTAGPTTNMAVLGQLTVGDFDRDGAADIATTSNLGTYLYFGDNTGNFTGVNATSAHGAQYYLMDIDGNGFSDLVGVGVASNTDQTNTYYRDVWVVYGNQFRNIIEQSIPLNGYAVPWTWGDSAPEKSPSVDVGDFNGDGLRDFAIVEAQNSDGSGTRTLAVKLNQLNYYTPEVNVYSNSNLDFGVAAIHDSSGLKPGLLVDTFADNTRSALFFLNDTPADGGGYFGSCDYPDSAIGIHVCSPDSYSSRSATFKASAAVQTTMGNIAVWVDGVMKYQDWARHDFSHYGQMNFTATLSKGKHHVTIIAAGYDNLEIRKSYSITVK
jgi:hypothetical protein